MLQRWQQEGCGCGSKNRLQASLLGCVQPSQYISLEMTSMDKSLVTFCGSRSYCHRSIVDHGCLHHTLPHTISSLFSLSLSFLIFLNISQSSPFWGVFFSFISPFFLSSFSPLQGIPGPGSIFSSKTLMMIVRIMRHFL